MEDELSRVVPLDDLDDFKVADGDPDVRGWEVIGADGRRIGEVDQLLVDTTAMKVRYLDVDVEEELFEGDEDRHVLIPIGFARLQDEDDRIIVDRLDGARVGGLPGYGREPLTRQYEHTVVRFYEPDYTATGGEEYSHQAYDDRRFYGTRGRERDIL